VLLPHAAARGEIDLADHSTFAPRRTPMALGPSERIRLVKEIARSIYDQDWGNANLIFDEFKVPHDSEGWGGEQDGYVLSTLRSANDAQLLGLADHYDLGFVQARATIEPKCWTSGHFRLFISHLAKYREEAGDLRACLKDFGISGFVAHNDIEPTLEWQNEIESALATCNAMVALMREGFHASKWTDQEIGCAMGRDRLVIAVRLGEDPYGFIGRFQGISGSALTSPQMATLIFDILKKNGKTKDLVAYGLVANFVISDSFREAKANTTLLSRAEYWDKSLSERCLVALERNGQINGATGVRSQLASIIKRHEETHAC
jgi:hypothetical protein